MTLSGKPSAMKSGNRANKRKSGAKTLNSEVRYAHYWQT
jgi:hypothetical protein